MYGMARIARIVIPGIPHNITQRGHRGENVFFSDKDRRFYLKLLKEYSHQYGLDILAYCLMPNHVHLVAIPCDLSSLATALKVTHLRYSQYVNWTYGMTGRLWHGRFFSCALDRNYKWVAIKYVERNPVRVKLVRKAEVYPWSSAPGHTGRSKDPLLSRFLEKRGNIGDWSAWLRERDDKEFIEQLRASTRTGRPLGCKYFLDRLEKGLGRTVRPKPRGRPPKNAKRKQFR